MKNLQQNTNSYSIEDLRGLMADLIRSQKTSEQKLEKLFSETDRRFHDIQKELGGIGRSNGLMAEEFFASALEKNLSVGKLRFDYIDRNLKRKRNNTQGEYDIILYNNYKVLIVEVKYIFREDQLLDFYKKRLKRFRTLFPEYKEYKLYGAIAAFSFENNVIEEAQKFGFYVLGQDNEKVSLINEKGFEPNEIK